MTDWDLKPLWAKQIERQLYELGALVRGQVPVVSSRIADVVEISDELRKEIDVVRQELKTVSDRQDKIATWIKANIPKKAENGS